MNWIIWYLIICNILLVLTDLLLWLYTKTNKVVEMKSKRSKLKYLKGQIREEIIFLIPFLNISILLWVLFNEEKYILIYNKEVIKKNKKEENNV